MASRLGYIVAPLFSLSAALGTAHAETAPAVERKVTEKAFGEWTLICDDPVKKLADSCILRSGVRSPETGQTLSVIFFTNADAPDTGGMLVLSSEENLHKPGFETRAVVYQELEPRQRYGAINLTVDEKACEAGKGCYFRIDLSPERMQYFATSKYLMFEVPENEAGDGRRFGFETDGTLVEGLKAMGYQMPALSLDQQ